MGFGVDAFCQQAEAAAGSLNGASVEGVGASVAVIAPTLHWDESRLASEAARWGARGFDVWGNALVMEITFVE
jgi:hypothetical protein